MQYKIPQTISLEIFRTYDIRGEVSEHSLTEDLTYAIGLAVGSQVQAQGLREIIVGRDGRLTGAALKEALCSGLQASGCDVIDIGRVSTALVYYATHTLSATSGVMVTGSHNPGNHNGFKIVVAGKTLTSNHIQGLLKRIQTQDFVTGSGSIQQVNIAEDFLSDVVQRLPLSKSLKVVVDSGNGIGGDFAPRLYQMLGCEVIPLYCEVDGHFPNHHPDPSVPENLQDLIAAVKKHKADVGIALDGDADRLGVVTDQGEIIWPDRQMMLFAIDLLSRQPGSEIIFDVKCTNNLPKVIEEYGGRPVMYRTGHSLIKEKMAEVKAPLAGEMSGHIFFKENWYGFDDGIYGGARLLQILSQDTRSCSEIFAQLPNSFNTPELKLPMAEGKKKAFMQRLLSEADFGDAEKITIDGLRVDFGYGWGLVRPSNTSPYLILRFEADTQQHLEHVKSIFKKVLLNLDEGLELPFSVIARNAVTR